MSFRTQILYDRIDGRKRFVASEGDLTALGSVLLYEVVHPHPWTKWTKEELLALKLEAMKIFATYRAERKPR